MHLKFGKIVCFVAAFCAATAVVAAAQTLTTLVRFDKTDGSEYWGLIRLIDPMSGFVTGLLKISNPMIHPFRSILMVYGTRRYAQNRVLACVASATPVDVQ